MCLCFVFPLCVNDASGIQCLNFFVGGKHSDGVSAMRFNMMVAVRGLMLRLVERVAR